MNYIYHLARAIHRAVHFHILNTTQFKSGLGDSAWLLYGLVRALRPDVCVEIGAARGRSTCYMAMALKENCKGRLYSIDPHTQTDWNDINSVDTYNILRKNLQRLRLEEYVEVLREFSEEIGKDWTRPIDILLIDGDHSYEGVKRDWDLFAQHVTQYGVVVFHDTLWEIDPDPRYDSYYRPDMGVPSFVEGLRQEGYPTITFGKNFGVTLVPPAKGGVSLTMRKVGQAMGDAE